jgi:hypothetical protein
MVGVIGVGVVVIGTRGNGVVVGISGNEVSGDTGGEVRGIVELHSEPFHPASQIHPPFCPLHRPCPLHPNGKLHCIVH